MCEMWAPFSTFTEDAFLRSLKTKVSGTGIRVEALFKKLWENCHERNCQENWLQDISATVKDKHQVYIYIEKQWWHSGMQIYFIY